MNEVYLMDEKSHTVPLRRIHCADESKELQDLLESNLDLLPGKQIDPDAPRKWLLIKREMPVTDPASGSDRWSIDFLLTDQFGIPTLVECKRHEDTRSRRETVGQMMEYAANGHHYWTSSDLQKFAETTAGGADALIDSLKSIRVNDDISVDEFFKVVEQNLREAKIRLIFFLDDSPNDLRSQVDFLNKQLKDTEVFLVEARQYQLDNKRIVVPWLFGFTEEARVAKRESRAATLRESGERGEDAYWGYINASNFSEDFKNGIFNFIDYWKSGPLNPYGKLSWGVNCIFLVPTLLSNRGLFSLTRNGSLEMYFGYWNENNYPDVKEIQIAFRDEFISLIEQHTGVVFTEKQRSNYPKVSISEWLPHANDLLDSLHAIAAKYVKVS